MENSFENSIFAIDISTLADPVVFDRLYQAQRSERKEKIA